VGDAAAAAIAITWSGAVSAPRWGGNVAGAAAGPGVALANPTVSLPAHADVTGGFNGVQVLVSVTATQLLMRVVPATRPPQLVAFQGTMQRA